MCEVAEKTVRKMSAVQLTPQEVLAKAVAEIRAKWLLPPPPSMKAKRRAKRRDVVLAAYAKAFVLAGDRVEVAERAIAEFLPPGVHLPTPSQLRRMGGVAAIHRRIAKGGLGIDGRLGVWSGGFFRGLRLSGALRPDAERGWAVWQATHYRLVADLASMPLPHSLDPPGKNGVRRFRRCPATSLPASDPHGVDVVAGLFSGAVHVRVDGDDWLELPADPEVVELLDTWAIAHKPGRVYRGKDRILVSPFFGALVSRHMPPRSAERALGMRRPGDCPWLAVGYWDWAMSQKGLQRIPFPDALPYGCSWRTAVRRGWWRKEIHRRAVLEMGITHLDRRLVELCKDWFARRSEARCVQDGKTQGAPPASPCTSVPAPPPDAHDGARASMC